jgi:indolepyruvate ferredoxin oxidoreductase beta subunit
MTRKFDLLITGVGGQGVILASNILSEVALTAGYDVKKTDTLGMAQRGGSVVSQVRVGRGVHSPLVRAGDVDIMIAFEKLEAARWSHYLRPGGVIIASSQALPPLGVVHGQERYPGDDEIMAILRRRSEQIYLVEAIKRAKDIGNVRAVNVFLLGCASVFLPLKINVWQDVISRHVPEAARRLNLTAFSLGRKEMSRVNIGRGAARHGAGVVDKADVRGGGSP